MAFLDPPPTLMPGLIWKIPVALAIALPVAAATLVTRAQSDTSRCRPALAPALRPPPDGLAKARCEAERAVEMADLRAAIHEFDTKEGRPPVDLAELESMHYLKHARIKLDLRHFRYDPNTMHVTRTTR